MLIIKEFILFYTPVVYTVIQSFTQRIKSYFNKVFPFLVQCIGNKKDKTIFLKVNPLPIKRPVIPSIPLRYHKATNTAITTLGFTSTQDQIYFHLSYSRFAFIKIQTI